MSERAINTAGETLLHAFLKDPLAIPRAIKARDFVPLAGAVQIASRGLSPSFAMTDPARYRGLRAAITAFHIRGYGVLDAPTLKKRAMATIARQSDARSIATATYDADRRL